MQIYVKKQHEIKHLEEIPYSKGMLPNGLQHKPKKIAYIKRPNESNASHLADDFYSIALQN